MTDTEEADLLRTFIRNIFQIEDDVHLYYFDVQKVLYYLKQRVSNDSRVADALPYYWYLDGPVCDPVQTAVDRGRNNELDIEESETGNGSIITPANDGTENQPDVLEEGLLTPSEFDEAREALATVLEQDYDVQSGYRKKLESVYEDAPYEFQRHCKIEVIREVNHFCSRKLVTKSPSDLTSLISEGELWLPTGREFDRFNDQYARYVTLSRRYLQSAGSDSVIGLDQLSDTTDAMWDAFSAKVRIVEHDQYYDEEEQLAKWRADFQQKARRFDKRMDEFERLLNEEFDTPTEGTLGVQAEGDGQRSATAGSDSHPSASGRVSSETAPGKAVLTYIEGEATDGGHDTSEE